MMGRASSNKGRRAVDRRPTITVTAAVDACNVVAALEREKARLAREWENLIPTTNGAHIGNFYNAKRKGQH